MKKIDEDNDLSPDTALQLLAAFSKMIKKDHLFTDLRAEISDDGTVFCEQIASPERWPSFQATMARARPIHVGADICDLVRANFEPFGEGKKLSIPKINLPFPELLIMGPLDRISNETSKGREGGCFTPFFFIKNKEDGIDFFKTELNHPNDQEDDAAWEQQVIYSELKFNQTTNGSPNQNDALLWLLSLESLVVENLMYSRKFKSKPLQYYSGNRIEKRHVSRINIVKCPRTIEIDLSKRSLSGRKIEFTHQFEVMGHWRRILGRGKDSSGERIELNRTWVNSHIRGPEHAPLKEKIRLLIPS